jgi:hypothetical protein
MRARARVYVFALPLFHHHHPAAAECVFVCTCSFAGVYKFIFYFHGDCLRKMFRLVFFPVLFYMACVLCAALFTSLRAYFENFSKRTHRVACRTEVVLVVGWARVCVQKAHTIKEAEKERNSYRSEREQL